MPTKFIKVDGKDRISYQLHMLPDSAQARMVKKFGATIATKSNFVVINGSVRRLEKAVDE